MQVIVEVEVEAGTYVSEQFQSRINAPRECPNCGIAQSLEAHGYYWRWVSETLLGRILRIAVRRFFCRCCAVTVSCLPRFAQPYRVICNATIEVFFEGRTDRSDVRAWSELLGRYRRTYQRWFGTLRMECGALFGRSPPEEEPLIFWDRIMGTCGGLAAATGKLVGQLRITLFGRYRCHQRRIFRA